MKKLAKEKQTKRRFRLKTAVVLIFFVVFILAAAQLMVSNRLADLGEEIEQETKQTESFIAENRILEEEIRQRESLAAITEEAKKIGFVETKTVYYLVPQVPVAMK